MFHTHTVILPALLTLQLSPEPRKNGRYICLVHSRRTTPGQIHAQAAMWDDRATVQEQPAWMHDRIHLAGNSVRQSTVARVSPLRNSRQASRQRILDGTGSHRNGLDRRDGHNGFLFRGMDGQ
jgi:hypothetical protein